MQNATQNAKTVIVGGVVRNSIEEVNEEQRATSKRKITQLVDRVNAIRTAKRDAVLDTRALTASVAPATDNAPKTLVLDLGSKFKLTVGDVAHEQFSSRLKIDLPYYRRMLADAPELLAENLNWWLQKTPETRLARMLQAGPALDEADNAALARTGAAFKLRAVLGKGYRTIDDAELVAEVLPVMQERGALLGDFSIDDRRMHAKFMTPARSVQAIREEYARKYGLTIAQVRQHTTINGKDVSWVDEVLSMGLYIRHSEIGFASLTASAEYRILKCLNDMIDKNLVNIRHVTGKRTVDENEDVRFLSSETQLMENAALIGRVRDSIGAAFDDEQAFNRVNQLADAKTDTLELPAGVPLFEFVGAIGERLNLTDAQTEVLKEETGRAVHEEGGRTRFAMVQGITATARQMTDYDRRTELERVGFEFLHDDPGALLKIARDTVKAAAKPDKRKK